ncbi:MAG: rRNA pseudouridine synthase [Dehalococcoidia bacterium]|nr:rRNA pseudouridine synthase [Dehalococcoidia bacterium]
MARARLQKVLADAGIASRRSSEKLILSGRVAVNGATVTQLGTSADPVLDRVTFDGVPISIPEPKRYLLLHKPRGYLSTARDERGRPTVMDLLGDLDVRVYPVGRLDKDSEGMIILTNDGDLALRLMHPSYEVEKEYLVLVYGRLSGEAIDKIKAGVEIRGRLLKPVLVETAKNVPTTIDNVDRGAIWVRIVLKEGYKREVRELCKGAGLWVRRLVRVRTGNLTLDGLAAGRYRKLTSKDLSDLEGRRS